MKHEAQPGHYCRQKADVRAGNRQDMHDAGGREIIDQLRTDALIATEQQGENCRRLLPRHDIFHLGPIMLLY